MNLRISCFQYGQIHGKPFRKWDGTKCKNVPFHGAVFSHQHTNDLVCVRLFENVRTICIFFSLGVDECSLPQIIVSNIHLYSIINQDYGTTEGLRLKKNKQKRTAYRKKCCIFANANDEEQCPVLGHKQHCFSHICERSCDAIGKTNVGNAD